MSDQSVVPVVDEMSRYLIIESLRQTGAELDRMRSQAAEAGNDDAVRLADAAHGVRSALAALLPE